MTPWIVSLLVGWTGKTLDLAKAVADRLHALWAAITGLGGRVFNAWARLYNRARRFMTATVKHAATVVSFLRWVVTVVIPHAAEVAVDQAVRLAARAWTVAVNAVRATVQSLSDWAIAAFNNLRSLTRQILDWATGQLAALAARARALEQRVFGVLSTPERLAAWILAPLVGLLVHYAMANFGRLVELAWRQRRAGEGLALDLAEEVIARIGFD